MITNPTQQRALRAHRPERPLPRVLNSAEHHAWLARHLTPRDRWLIRMLFEHHVFTTHQIVDLCFPSRRAANLRLRCLYQWGVVHRFQPHRDNGTHPMHYVLDTAGAVALAREEGRTPAELGYNRDREIGRAYSLQLAHTVGCNSLFTALVHHTRDHAGELASWWSAARCARHWGDIVKPDAYARWRDNTGAEVEWFTEFDFGTETLHRLAAKLPRYHRLADSTGITTPVLFWFPTAQRETSACRALGDALRALDHPDLVPVATTNADASPNPVDLTLARWLPLNGAPATGRITLADLRHSWPQLRSATSPNPAPVGVSGEPRTELPAPAPCPPGAAQRGR
ncbi:replication-relaxation family protein [Amycolatopsis sp. NPDC059657]|uniref:replication-relaxation family protein n=1 Tax=Amycolatopsis sp. NPDC059657 TaxID=3346899 RepID=UPI00366B18C6